MAREVVITDDITGEPGAEAHVIIVDGRGVEVDLADASLERLVEALAPFWRAGTVADYEVTRRYGKRKGAPPSTNGARPRGRPPGGGKMATEALVAYVREHPGATSGELAEAFGVHPTPVNKRAREHPELLRLERGGGPGAPWLYHPADHAKKGAHR
jgi:hypothetical protein